SAEHVRVYEKLRAGIWANNGLFELVDSWVEDDGRRKVFKFKLSAIQERNSNDKPRLIAEGISRRIIPTSVKLEVWKRDNGKCSMCGSNSELHFDHIIPYAKGGTSLRADNIQLLCARHNLEKHDRIV
ncbi:MAG TPA: HNH endonuclease signature motif containing protein, partial [Anaerolineales bacterium]|nr:HNH endonuclease signature motif containing protein [Anaerolineales bacterium]